MCRTFFFSFFKPAETFPHGAAQLLICRPVCVSLRLCLHVRRSSCVEMTGLSQRCDTFGPLFSLHRGPVSSQWADTTASRNASTHLRRRHSHPVILLFKSLLYNRSSGGCFESAVRFLMPLHINSKEPALPGHMVRHPLINATQCCVTKSQLHPCFFFLRLICSDSGGWHLNQQPPEPSPGINGSGCAGRGGWQEVMGALISFAWLLS